MVDLYVEVSGYGDSDIAERARLASQLRQEILALDVVDVRHATSDAPPNSKGVGLDWAHLIVSVVGTIPPIVTAIQAWKDRHPGVRVSLTIDGDTICLEGISDVERRELLRKWMSHHAD